ncbi:MAG: LamG domain-containing protein, partial [Phycisphaerales bacterium]|nr:LamG domain-containing protein [Phycisphaerales bacterium]
RVIAAKPVGFWPLDEASGTVRAKPLVGAQAGGYSKNTVPGRLTADDGRPAPWMDSSTTFAFIPHHDALLIDEGTVMCSFYCDSEVAGDQTILAKDRPGDNGDGHFRLFLSDKLKLFVRVETSKDTQELAIADLTPQTWYHVSVSVGSNGVCACLNGVKKKHDKNITTLFGPASGGSGNLYHMAIGVWHNGTAFVESLNGSVRDLVLFDRQLTAKEVTDLLTDPAPGEFAIDTDSWAWVVD